MGLLNFLFEFWEKHPRVELILFAIALHGMLAPFTGLKHDMQVWFSVIDNISKGINIYEVALTTDEYYAYPPLWAYILYFTNQFTSMLSFDSVFFGRFLIKLPLILSQVIVAFLGSSILKQEGLSEKNQNIAFTILILNPYFFLIGSIWGMFDIIALMFVFASIYITLKIDPTNSNPILSLISGGLMSLSILTKIYPIILVPVFLIYLIKRLNWLFFLFGLSVISVIVCLPYFILNPEAFISAFTFHANRIGGGVTYWNGIWLFVANGSMTIAEATSITSLYVFPFTLFLAITYLIYFKNFERANLTLAICLIVFVFAISFKLIYEQYYVFIMAFGILFLLLNSNFSKIGYFQFFLLIILPSIYLIISVPFPDLFYVEMINQQSAIFELLFIDKQLILFSLSVGLVGLHFYFWLKGIFELKSN